LGRTRVFRDTFKVAHDRIVGEIAVYNNYLGTDWSGSGVQIRMVCLCQCVLAAFFFLGALCSAQETYFPPKLYGAGQIAASWAESDAFLLNRLEEPSLFTRTPDISAEAYRFLWFRTFHSPIAVRMDVQPDGRSLLTIKVADGESGFPRTVKKLIQNTTRALSRERTDAFRKKLAGKGFWEAASRDKGGPAATDCDSWMIEGLRAGTYHVVERAIPNRLPKTGEIVQSLGLTLAIELGQIDIPKEER
jgi:hypothetical protein